MGELGDQKGFGHPVISIVYVNWRLAPPPASTLTADIGSWLRGPNPARNGHAEAGCNNWGTEPEYGRALCYLRFISQALEHSM